jgi:hypothetical protein
MPIKQGFSLVSVRNLEVYLTGRVRWCEKSEWGRRFRLPSVFFTPSQQTVSRRIWWLPEELAGLLKCGAIQIFRLF